MAKTKRKRHNPWSNYGNGIQVYDVCFEVDKLDYIKKTEGKESDKYKKQHGKTVKLINNFNSEIPGRFPLNISRCRAIMQGTKYYENIVFYNEGKIQVSNRENLESEK